MIRAQVLYSKLAAIAAEMGERLRRTARSPGITEQQAFATALFTGDLSLAVQRQEEPSHLFAMRASVRGLFDYFAFDLAEGDVLAVADPYHGGTDPQTMTLALPIFHGGEIVLFPAVRAALPDLAGEYPGAVHPEAFELWQENIRVTPVKLHRAGMPQRDLLRFLTRNSRTPTALENDLAAMIAACREAGQAIGALLDRHGSHEIVAAVAEMQAYARRRVDSYVAALSLQGDPGEAEMTVGDHALGVRVAIARGKDSLSLDFAGTDAAVSAPFNLTPEGASAFAALPLLAPLLDEVPINEGTLAPFAFNFPAGSLLNPPFPATTGLGARTVGHVVAAAVSRALGDAGAALHGAQPVATLFPPIGTQRESVPIALDPGFAISAQAWGPPPLAGARLLVSAEEFEVRDGFRMLTRDRDETGGMRVAIENRRGALEGNFLVVTGPDGPAGDVRLDDQPPIRGAAAGLKIAPDSVIAFHYPNYATANAEAEVNDG